MDLGVMPLMDALELAVTKARSLEDPTIIFNFDNIVQLEYAWQRMGWHISGFTSLKAKEYQVAGHDSPLCMRSSGGQRQFDILFLTDSKVKNFPIFNFISPYNS